MVYWLPIENQIYTRQNKYYDAARGYWADDQQSPLFESAFEAWRIASFISFINFSRV